MSSLQGTPAYDRGCAKSHLATWTLSKPHDATIEHFIVDGRPLKKVTLAEAVAGDTGEKSEATEALAFALHATNKVLARSLQMDSDDQIGLPFSLR